MYLNWIPLKAQSLSLGVQRNGIFADEHVVDGGIATLKPHNRLEHTETEYHLLCHGLVGTVESRQKSFSQTIAAPQVLLVPAGVSCHVHITNAPCSITWFHLRNTTRWQFLETNNMRVLRLLGWKKIHEVFRSYFQISKDDKPGSKRADIALAKAVIALLDRSLEPMICSEPFDSIHRQFQSLWQEVANNPAHRWTIAEMASRFCLSSSRFAHIAKQHLQQPPMQVVTELRIKKAEELLHTTALPLKEISYRIGYSDVFAFSAAYKRLRGRSPSVARAEISRTYKIPPFASS